MSKCAGVEPATVDTSSVTTPPAPPSLPVVQPDRGSARLRVGGYVLVGLGVAAGVTAGVFAMSARSDARDVRSKPAGSPWSQDLIDQEQHGKQAQTRSRIFSVVAAAAVVGGGLMWWAGRDRGTHVELAVGERHAEVALTCAF
jgi:hypothetical protein